MLYGENPFPSHETRIAWIAGFVNKGFARLSLELVRILAFDTPFYQTLYLCLIE